MSANRRGFAIIEILLIAVVVGLLGFVAYRVFWSDKETPAESTETLAPVSEETEEVVDPTAEWEKYTSEVGKFSFKHPNDWNLKVCDASAPDHTVYIGPTPASSVICNSEHFSQIQIVSTAAVPTESEQTLESENYKNVTDEEVVVDGVTGKRTTGVLKADHGFPGWEAGTLNVQYFFLTPGRSYIAIYIQTPSGDYAEDHLEEFDLMVQETLKFTN